MQQNYKTLEEKIGYSFTDTSLLIEALTHSSYANEMRQKNIAASSNERLEFLGDAVLEIISSSYLFAQYPSLPEGELTRMRAEAICTEALSSYAKKLGLGDYLLLGNGEKKSGGKNKPSTLENAFEALLGAIFLDSGCVLDKVSTFVIPFISKRAVISETDIADYKSELQQIIQQTPGETLSYDEISKTGPDNAPTFTVVAKLNSNIIGRGVGQSKKKAEQQAAKDALKFFNHKRK